MTDKIVILESKLTTAEVIDRLKSQIASKNIKLFAHIDHQDAATESGLELHAEQVLVFGDPGVGTHLMQENPELGLELPLKILVWNDGSTKIAYREPLSYLNEFGIVQNKVIIEKMSALMAMLVKSAAG